MEHAESKYRVGILGATGMVGQTFVSLLEDHPWFEVTALAASGSSAGRRYGDVVSWVGSNPIPAGAAQAVVQEPHPGLPCDIVFSGLPADVANQEEPVFAEAGYAVVSNARSFRLHNDVPLLVPELNPDHLELAAAKSEMEGGYIVTNPNCSTVGLACVLKPLHDAFGITTVHVATLQALSGAGYPGVPSLDIVGNVIPYIRSEEEKVESEPLKILGRLVDGRVREADFSISAQCNRVPVLDGHTLCVSVGFRSEVSPMAVADVLERYESPISHLDLPSAPERLLQVLADASRPQPRRDAQAGGGMTVSVGRIRTCPVLDIRLVAVVHNTVRGAAGGAILNAELLVAKGMVRRREAVAISSSHAE